MYVVVCVGEYAQMQQHINIFVIYMRDTDVDTSNSKINRSQNTPPGGLLIIHQHPPYTYSIMI